MKFRLGLVVLFLSFFSNVLAQEIDGISFYITKSHNDTIDFIRIGKGDTKKPTLIFCQGSLPIPLIVRDGDSFFVPSVNNFDYKKMAEKLNVVIISMPSIPVVVDKSALDNYMYKPNGQFLPEYINNNYLEKYVERGISVINFLKKQKWVDKEKMYILGHSQGAQVAIEIAKENKNIAAVGYLSGNVLGRFSKYILQNRLDEQNGSVTSQDAQKNIDQNIEWWTALCRDSISLQNGDTNRTWKSFGKENISTISKLKQPVFVAYGTKDVGSSMCDLLPIYFELAGKTDYKLYPAVGCGHNFEEFLPNGDPDYDNMHWQDVIDEFMQFIYDSRTER